MKILIELGRDTRILKDEGLLPKLFAKIFHAIFEKHSWHKNVHQGYKIE